VREQLTGSEAAFLSEARVAHLATLDPGGSPHVVPVCPVLDLDRLVIASAYDRKIANIRGDSAVALCADEYSEDWDGGLRQVIVEGDAYLIETGPEFERDRALLYEKFPQYERVSPIEEGGTVIIEFRVARVSSSGL
jgi:PPOX class probable F420-dependent enzyme